MIPEGHPVDVSMVLIAYNEADKIVRTVRAVLAQEAPVSLEVLVVDDASTDATATEVETLAQEDDRVRLVRFPENRGRGAARHAGVTAARGALIGFADADVLLPRTWLATCLDALRDHDAVAGIAVPDGDVAWVHSAFGLEPKVDRHTTATTAVTGNNALFRRSVFEQVNFDPTLRNGEDVKMGVVMRARGMSAHTVPGLVVEHVETKSYATSLAWLYESGCGATRQMVRDRTVRLPDVVAAGFHLATAAGVAYAGTRRDGRLLAAAALLPPIAAAAHLRTKFRLARTPLRSLGAWACHTPLMTAYLVGRAVGYVDVARGTAS